MGQWKSLKTDSGTGWKEIYRDAGSGGWKALAWESAPIDVGAACANRATEQGGEYSLIEKSNPANVSGTLTNVCIYMHSVNAGSCYVGVFEFVSGTTYKCKAAANVGALSAGANNEAVSLSIAIGEYIGIYLPNVTTQIEWTWAGTEVMWLADTNTCVVDNQSVYGSSNNAAISLYGTG